MTTEPVEPPAPQSGDKQAKRRAACDECRLKKLKCTGEQPACSRCVRESIDCVYSVQKQMGRPKKRQRSDEEGNAVDTTSTGGRKRNQSSRAVDGTTNPPHDTFDPSTFSADAWLLPPTSEWDHPLPSLTSASSNDATPPLLNLPPSLRNHPPDTSTALLLSPSPHPPPFPDLNLGHPPDYPSCACLSTIYLTLNTLSATSTSFAFPSALHPLRQAMETASAALHCPSCPQRFITGIQNTQLLGTLLLSIADRFSKTLASITAEAARASAAHESKSFCLADLSTPTSHLHTGGLGCAAAFSLALSPPEWKVLAKKVVRAEVYGASGGNACCVSLTSLISDMHERQERFHREKRPLEENEEGGGEEHLQAFGRAVGGIEGEAEGGGRKDGGEGRFRGSEEGECKARDGRAPGEKEHLCQKVAGVAGRMVGEFDWD